MHKKLYKVELKCSKSINCSLYQQHCQSQMWLPCLLCYDTRRRIEVEKRGMISQNSAWHLVVIMCLHTSARELDLSMLDCNMSNWIVYQIAYCNCLPITNCVRRCVRRYILNSCNEVCS